MVLKTDTDNTLRVTLTFHRDSQPEWFGVLRHINQGKVRSDIVREHLSRPDTARYGAASEQPQYQPSPTPSTKPPPALAPTEVNSQQTDAGIDNKSADQAVGYEPTPVIKETLPRVPPTAQINMASLLMGAGISGV